MIVQELEIQSGSVEYPAIGTARSPTPRVSARPRRSGVGARGLVPLNQDTIALTPVLFYALAGGVLNLGGGEKDILFVVPWLLRALVFAGSCWILWFRGHALGAGLWRAALAGLAGLIAAAIVWVSLASLAHSDATNVCAVARRGDPRGAIAEPREVGRCLTALGADGRVSEAAAGPPQSI